VKDFLLANQAEERFADFATNNDYNHLPKSVNARSPGRLAVSHCLECTFFPIAD
jgi:hypothetical protein